MDWITECLQRFPDTVFRRDEPLSAHTTFRVGGPSALYAEPAAEADLIGLLETANQLSIPCFVLGRGSNLLVSDAGFPGLVAATSRMTHIEVNGNIITLTDARGDNKRHFRCSDEISRYVSSLITMKVELTIYHGKVIHIRYDF